MALFEEYDSHGLLCLCHLSTPVLIPTDRGGCLDGFDCSFKHFLGQTKVGGATVHDALVIVVLRERREG